jgi:Xaa-Pro aminopeptidase
VAHAQPAHADYARRLAETRTRVRDAGLDALLVSNPYNRRYLTGFSARDGDITESSGLALVAPNRLGLITGTFNLTGLEHEIEPSDAEVLSTDEKLPWDVLAEAVRQDNIKRLGFEKAWLSYDRYDRMKKALGDEVELVPSDDLVRFVRASKDSAEIEMLRRAAKVGDQAFREMTRQIRVGMTERQIAALLERLMVEQGAEGPSFPSIVAGGPGGATPHWEPSDRPVQAGEPLLIDFGVRVDGYCSDATRTLCFGEPDPQLVEIYGVVRRAQDAVIQALQAGVRRGREIDAAARKVIDESPYKDKFIHGLGHGVGLAVHELPSAGRLRINTPEMDAELAKVEQIGDNMTLTNEPGVYIPGWGGVRLEDTLLITADGVESLTERNPEWILSLPIQ